MGAVDCSTDSTGRTSVVVSCHVLCEFCVGFVLGALVFLCFSPCFLDKSRPWNHCAQCLAPVLATQPSQPFFKGLLGLSWFAS